jgi:hypothetical protein
MSWAGAHIWPIAHIWAPPQQFPEHLQSEELQAIELNPFPRDVTGQLALKKFQLFSIMQFNSAVSATAAALGAFVMKDPFFTWAG